MKTKPCHKNKALVVQGAAGAAILLSATAGFAQPTPELPGAESPADLQAPIPEMVPPEPTPEPVAGYAKGFFIRSDDGLFALKIGGRVQTRFTYEALEGAADEVQFSIPRARMALSGHAFAEELTYKFEADFGKGQVASKDFYTNYEAVPDWLFIQVGQAKRPFSRQQITSSSKLQFVDRAVTDKAFGAGRDIGVMLHNNYQKSPELEYALGFYNGTGDATAFSGSVVVDPETFEGSVSGGKFSNVPDRFGPALVGRLGYNFGDYAAYSEADLKGGDLRLAVGASGLLDLEHDTDGEETMLGEVDFDLKAHGFSATGAFYVCSSKASTGCFGGAEDALGLHFQTGYVIAERFEPALRVAAVGNDGKLDQVLEVAGGFSVYMIDHLVKLQTDVARLSYDGGNSDLVSRTQLQFSF